MIITPKIPNAANELENSILSFGMANRHPEKPLQVLSNFIKNNFEHLFLRKNVPLEIIILTDDYDKSEISTQQILTLLANTKVRIHSISPLKTKLENGCFTSNVKNHKLSTLSKKTNGTLINVCDDKDVFETNFSRLANKIASKTAGSTPEETAFPIQKLLLGHHAKLDSIKIYFGSQELKRGFLHTGWIIDEHNHSILFGSEINLRPQPPGTKHKIIYDIH